MSEYVFFNGNIVSKSEAKISVDDRGFHFGDGLYDILLIHKGKIIDFDLHHARLQNTAEKIYLKLDYSKEEILRFSKELIEKNGIISGRLMIVISRGEADRWLTELGSITQNFVISTQNYDSKVGQGELKFLKLKSYSDIRWKWRDIKITSLLPSVIARREVADLGFDEVLYFNENTGEIEETSRGNIFIIKGNKVITPPLSQNLLSGITRNRIVQILRENSGLLKGYEMLESAVFIEDIYSADEVFSASATARVVGVARVDDVHFTSHKITLEILKIYDNWLGQIT